MSALIDTHCHLHREEFDADREQVLARARAEGVTALVNPATDFASNQAVAALAKERPEVYAAVGIHPHDSQELTPEALGELERLAHEPKVVAIGEIGLDYFRELSPRDAQRKTFRALLMLARSVDLPVILHCRGEGAADSSAGQGKEAFQDLFALLKEVFTPPIRGVVHCFSGDAAVAEEAMRLGLLISFAGNLTFPRSEPLRAVAQELPLERVVLETDAPFLAPQSHRGKRNEPSYLSELVRLWGRLRGISPEEIAHITTDNAMRLFGIQGNS